MATTTALLQPAPCRSAFRSQISGMQLQRPSLISRRTQLHVAARAEGKVTREYNENDGQVSSGDKKQPLYADEVPPRKNTMSKEQQAKLREEYLSLGGSPNRPIPNYFLTIILGISFLAILSWLSGAI